MLRISPVTAGGERYYFSTVAATTDIRGGLIEADPYWLGAGTSALGLSGDATLEQVRALFAGAHPATGEEPATGRAGPRKNVAFDIVMSTPKSVSILYALASPEPAARVGTAHRRAVEATLAHIEQDLLRAARRDGHGSGEERWHVEIDGAVAVGFLHRTSRAADPHLHTHVLVTNLGLGRDDRWTALDSRRLYAAQAVTWALFETQLRHELTKVGLRFGQMKGNFADVAGIYPEAVQRFSKMSEEIQANRARAGLAPWEALRADGQERPPKDRSRSVEDLVPEWMERANECGLSQNRLDRAAGFEPRFQRVGGLRERDRTEVSLTRDDSWLEGVRTVGDGTFAKQDMVIALCRSLQAGAEISEITAGVEAVAGTAAVVRVGDRFTTVRQQELIAESAARLGELARETGACLLAYDAAGGPGRAGALEAAAQLRPLADGGRVVGVAPGRAAAARVEASTGVETFPVKHAALLEGHLRPGDVVLLADAASMLEEELTETLSLCRSAGARPVLLASQRSVEMAGILRTVSEEAARIAPIEGWIVAAGATAAQDRAELRALGPRLTAAVVPDVARACEAALNEALSQQADGRETLLVLPDRSLVLHVRAALETGAPGSSIAVLQAHDVGAYLSGSGGGPGAAQRSGAAAAGAVAVIVGGVTPLGLRTERLAALERVHVVVAADAARDPSAALARAGEAARAPHLVSELGPVRPDPAARAGWRQGAAAIESFRERHGITTEARPFGALSGTIEGSAVRSQVQELRTEMLVPVRERAGGRRRSPDVLQPQLAPASRPDGRDLGGRGLFR